MGLVTPSQSNPGDTIEAADINTPVNQLAAVLNGNVDSSNLADGAITNQKVATGVSAIKLLNPYKFSVYRSAAQSLTAPATSIVQFDTKSWDTGSNVDIVTNKGRFTATASGFYQFNWSVAVIGGSPIFTAAFKNGTEYRRGARTDGTTGQFDSTGSAQVQLAVGDYVDIRAYVQSGSPPTLEVGQATVWFDGFLVSAS